MAFNNRNNFHSFPLTKNVGCLGFLIGAIVISAILFLSFFVGWGSWEASGSFLGSWRYFHKFSGGFWKETEK